MASNARSAEPRRERCSQALSRADFEYGCRCAGTGECSLTSRSLEFTLAFVVCLSAVAIDISLPAIPAILDDLKAEDAYGQLIVAIYLLGYAIGQLPFGLLADRVGRLPALRVGLFLFLAASAATVLAPNIYVLLGARFLQGIGGASAAVIARAIARDVSDGAELTRLASILVASLAIATLIAPLAGSITIYLGNWRGVFGVSLLMGVVAVALMVTNIVETRSPEQEKVHLFRQLTQSTRAFLHSRQSIWGATIVGFTFFAYMGIVAGIAQVTVDAYGMSSAAVGLVFSGAVVFYVSAGRIGGRIAKRVGANAILHYGILAFVVAAICCSLNVYIQPQSFWFFWWGLIPFFIGMGLVFPAATAITLEPLPSVAGFAASILGTFQILVSVVGASVTGFFYDGTNISVLAVVITGSVVTSLVYFAGRSSRLR